MQDVLISDFDDRSHLGPVIIYLRDVTYRELQHLIQFIYSGKTEVPYEQLAAFMALANGLGVKGFTTGAGGAGETANASSPQPQYSNISPMKRKKIDEHNNKENLASSSSNLMRHSSSEPVEMSPAKKRAAAAGTRLKAKSSRSMDDIMQQPPQAPVSRGESIDSSTKEVPHDSSSSSNRHSSTPPKTPPLSPLTLPPFWTDAPSSIVTTTSPPRREGQTGQGEGQDLVFKRPSTPPPQPYSSKIRHSNTASCPVEQQQQLHQSADKKSASGGMSFDCGSNPPPQGVPDPNELAAKGATLLHHLALWMIEERRATSNQQHHQEQEEQLRGKRPSGMSSEGEMNRPDSGFDSDAVRPPSMASASGGGTTTTALASVASVASVASAFPLEVTATRSSSSSDCRRSY